MLITPCSGNPKQSTTLITRSIHFGESQQLYELSRPCLIKTHVQGSTCLKTQICKNKTKHKHCKRVNEGRCWIIWSLTFSTNKANWCDQHIDPGKELDDERFETASNAQCETAKSQACLANCKYCLETGFLSWETQFRMMAVHIPGHGKPIIGD